MAENAGARVHGGHQQGLSERRSRHEILKLRLHGGRRQSLQLGRGRCQLELAGRQAGV